MQSFKTSGSNLAPLPGHMTTRASFIRVILVLPISRYILLRSCEPALLYSADVHSHHCQTTEGGKAGSEVNVNLNHQVYYHVIGTKQEDDPLIFHIPDEPSLIFGVEITGTAVAR